MLPFNKLTEPGEHPFFFRGEAGEMEAILMVPHHCQTQTIALLGHPHSLQGGSMNNKVVTTMARAFREMSIPSLRFNFRGVGLSAGIYDHGIGESNDMMTLFLLWQAIYPTARGIFAGFSFGSYVTYRVATQLSSALLLSVAPPVHHYNYRQFSPRPGQWHIFQGEQDEVVPLQTVLDFAANETPAIPVTCFKETTHFFHGKLLPLKNALIDVLQQ